MSLLTAHTLQEFESFVTFFFTHCLNYCIFIFVLYIYQSFYIVRSFSCQEHTILYIGSVVFILTKNPIFAFLKDLSQEQLSDDIWKCTVLLFDFILFFQEQPKTRPAISKGNGSTFFHCLVVIKQDQFTIKRKKLFHLSISLYTH